MIGRIVAFGIAALVIALQLTGQQANSELTKLRKLNPLESAGPVPVLYVPSAKERAMRFQKSLEAAHSWYEKQLKVQVPLTLAILDSETWAKDVAKYPMAHSEPFSGLVVLPDYTDGIRPGHTDDVQAMPGADPDHAPGGVLAGEGVLFHEAGHVFAYALGIRSGNAFVNELIADLFAVGYIGAERPDLNWLLEDRRSDRFEPTGQRYTSLADLDYLYTGVGTNNYYWFQRHLERLADFLVQGQSFPSVIEKLQKSFPAADAKQETLDEIDTRLEAIRPGFLKAAGPLTAQSTITRITPSVCGKATKRGGSSSIVVQNDTDDRLFITDSDGHSLVPVRIKAHAWDVYEIAAGSSLKLPDGTCLVARDEPTLAVIGKR